jgi:hypothetical protein
VAKLEAELEAARDDHQALSAFLLQAEGR